MDCFIFAIIVVVAVVDDADVGVDHNADADTDIPVSRMIFYYQIFSLELFL